MSDIVTNIIAARVQLSLHSRLVLWSTSTFEVARFVSPAETDQFHAPTDLTARSRCYSLSGAWVDPTALFLRNIPIISLSRSSRSVDNLRAREFGGDRLVYSGFLQPNYISLQSLQSSDRVMSIPVCYH